MRLGTPLGLETVGMRKVLDVRHLRRKTSNRAQPLRGTLAGDPDPLHHQHINLFLVMTLSRSVSRLNV